MKHHKETIEGFGDLKKNWESYEGKVISAKAIDKALETLPVLSAIFGNDNLFFAPLGNGGIQIEIDLKP